MPYRPYPNVERALRRVRRGGKSSSVERVPVVVPAARRESRASVVEAFPVGHRVMSTRRLGG